MLPIVRIASHGPNVGPPDAAERPAQYRHAMPVLGCLIRGGGRYQTGEADLQIRAPAIALLPANVRDGNGLVGPYESFWCQFDWDGVRAASGTEARADFPEGRVRRPFLRQAAQGELRGIMEIFRKLQLWSRRPDATSMLRASAALMELLAIWAQPPETSPALERSMVLYRNLIEQYAEDPRYSLEDIAGRVGMSAEYLSVLFRREFGVTPVAYRESLRLARAKELLVATNWPVTRIAREVGYPDANYFARVFRKATGMPPLSFARKHATTRQGGS